MAILGPGINLSQSQSDPKLSGIELATTNIFDAEHLDVTTESNLNLASELLIPFILKFRQGIEDVNINYQNVITKSKFKNLPMLLAFAMLEHNAHRVELIEIQKQFKQLRDLLSFILKREKIINLMRELNARKVSPSQFKPQYDNTIENLKPKNKVKKNPRNDMPNFYAEGEEQIRSEIALWQDRGEDAHLKASLNILNAKLNNCILEEQLKEMKSEYQKCLQERQNLIETLKKLKDENLIILPEEYSTLFNQAPSNNQLNPDIPIRKANSKLKKEANRVAAICVKLDKEMSDIKVKIDRSKQEIADLKILVQQAMTQILQNLLIFPALPEIECFSSSDARNFQPQDEVPQNSVDVTVKFSDYTPAYAWSKNSLYLSEETADDLTQDKYQAIPFEKNSIRTYKS